MINDAVYQHVRILSELLHDCGWSVARCEKFAGAMLETMLSCDRVADRDRKAIEAAKLLPTLGPDLTSERLNVSRRNVYYLAEAGNREIVQEKPTACTVA
jgi:hypothetical protein